MRIAFTSVNKYNKITSNVIFFWFFFFAISVDHEIVRLCRIFLLFIENIFILNSIVPYISTIYNKYLFNDSLLIVVICYNGCQQTVTVGVGSDPSGPELVVHTTIRGTIAAKATPLYGFFAARNKSLRLIHGLQL